MYMKYRQLRGETTSLIIIKNKMINFFLLFSVVSINGNYHDKQFLLISPSSSEVVHFVNDSHIVTCSVNKGSKIKWINPKGNIIPDTRGRVHVEDRSLTTVGTSHIMYLL